MNSSHSWYRRIMKTILVVAGLCALVLAVPTKSVPKKHKVDDKVLLERQRDILRLFKNVNLPTGYKNLVEIAANFQPENHLDKYTRPQDVKEFMRHYKLDLLPRGEIFSVFFSEHLEQAIPLFRMMYHAKDYETFYKTAVWARQNVNEGMWLYTVSVAIVHRPDTFGVVLPPIYEIYPFYFFSSEVLQEAQRRKQMSCNEELPKDKDGYIGHTIESNYTGWYLNLHPEQSLSYLTEDVGVNSFYYYYNIFYPFWLGGEGCTLKTDNRGEMYYYIHQQLLARYYLERLSNDFGEIPVINLDWPVETGYYSSLRYPNGLDFPARRNQVLLTRNWENTHPFYNNYTNSLTYLKDFGRRIRDAIDLGYIYTHNGNKVFIYDEQGFDTLGNLIEGNPDSPNAYYYGALQVYARHILGYAHLPIHKYKLAPSVLEHFETSLRDPVFYQMYKKIILNFFQEYKRHLPRYTTKDLILDGVKIDSIKVDRLITYFDWFDSDLSNGVYYGKKEQEDDTFRVRVRQQRLNHKPFTYTINVDSVRDIDAVVRVFVGPKRDEYGREIDINENRLNFFQIDKFITTLKTGKNAILRNSQQSYLVPDRTSYRELCRRVVNAIAGKEQLQLDGSESYFGFPRRFMLPTGKVGGQIYQLYVIISPYDKSATTVSQTLDEVQYPRPGTGRFMRVDNLPLGFPFDRQIDFGFMDVPNSLFQDVTIYHKQLEDLNVTN